MPAPLCLLFLNHIQVSFVHYARYYLASRLPFFFVTLWRYLPYVAENQHLKWRQKRHDDPNSVIASRQISRLSKICVAILAIWQYRLGMHWKPVLFKIAISWTLASNCQYCQIAVQVFLRNFARYYLASASLSSCRHNVMSLSRYSDIPVRFVHSTWFNLARSCLSLPIPWFSPSPTAPLLHINLCYSFIIPLRFLFYSSNIPNL